MALSIHNLPKQARPMFEIYEKREVQGTFELYKKVEHSFLSLADTKVALSKAKRELPSAEDLAKTQETWLGRVVDKLNTNNCFLKMITCILCAIFPSFKQEVEKQNAIQMPIQQVETLRENKKSQLKELEQLFKEFKYPEVLDNDAFLSKIFQDPQRPVSDWIKCQGENFSINYIDLPLIRGKELAGDRRHFFIIVAKIPNGMLSGLVCLTEPTGSGQSKSWSLGTIDGIPRFQLSDAFLVDQGFIQKQAYTFLTTLIQQGTATLIDHNQKPLSYTLATREEIANFKKQKQQKNIYF